MFLGVILISEGIRNRLIRGKVIIMLGRSFIRRGTSIMMQKQSIINKEVGFNGGSFFYD